MTISDWTPGRARKEEALRLVIAFSGIEGADRRRAIIDLAKCFQREGLPSQSQLTTPTAAENVVYLPKRKR